MNMFEACATCSISGNCLDTPGHKSGTSSGNVASHIVAKYIGNMSGGSSDNISGSKQKMYVQCIFIF